MHLYLKFFSKCVCKLICVCVWKYEWQSIFQGEARLRVLSLYKAWRRHIPIMCKDFDLPRTEAQCQAALRSIWRPSATPIFCFASEDWYTFIKLITCFWQEGVSEKCTSEGYSCDWYDHYQGTSSLKGPSQFCNCTLSFVHELQWSLNIFQGQQDLQEVVNHWKQVTHIFSQRTISYLNRKSVSVLVLTSVISILYFRSPTSWQSGSQRTISRRSPKISSLNSSLGWNREIAMGRLE